jgi:alpha-beta hydrolase superfamily lysophospholipase
VNPYTYERVATPANVQLVGKRKKWLQYSVDFPTAHPTRYREFNTVRGVYYRSLCEERAPLAIMVHGMGDNTVLPWRFLAPSLTGMGISCFILYLPFHSSRMPESISGRIPYLTADEWFEGYQLSVIDIRQVIDWSADRREMDNDKTAVLGISYGGLVSAIAMGIDSRLKAGVFVVTGGNHGKMSWLSKSKVYSNGYPRSEAEYLEGQRIYAEYLSRVEQSGFESVQPASPAFLTDPMTFAVFLRQRPVLMLNAKKDKYISSDAVNDFWHACGEPSIKWFPSGHMSIWVWYPLITKQIKSFLLSVFELHER